VRSRESERKRGNHMTKTIQEQASSSGAIASAFEESPESSGEFDNKFDNNRAQKR
jgi:hypothetical protein